LPSIGATPCMAIGSSFKEKSSTRNAFSPFSTTKERKRLKTPGPPHTKLTGRTSSFSRPYKTASFKLRRDPHCGGFFFHLSIFPLVGVMHTIALLTFMAAKRASNDPFAKLFGSAVRIRLIRLFLFNPKKMLTAAEAAKRARVSTADARRELKLLVDAGLLRKNQSATARYATNSQFPFLESFQQMILNAPLRGNDIYTRMRGVGVIKLVVLSGIFAGSFDGGLDVLVVGDRINEKRLRRRVKALEADIGTELRFASFTTPDFTYRLTVSDRFIRDVFDYSHRIIFDRLGIGLQ